MFHEAFTGLRREAGAVEQSAHPNKAPADRPARETCSAQLGGFVCEDSNAFVPAIHLGTTYRRSAEEEIPTGPIYGRSDNPTFGVPERVITELEGGADSLLYSSGMAAAAGLVFSLQPGDRIVAPANFYAGIWEWLTTIVVDWRITLEFVDFSDFAELERAVTREPCRLIWLETPTTPSLGIVDVAAVASLARSAGAKLLVDNTSATPVLTRPLQLGADFVLHSATKALNGHDDVIAGALVARRQDELWDRLRSVRNKNGAIIGPFEAWLLGRGMRTLFVRVRHACDSTERIARTLRELCHRNIDRVTYPGFLDHPGHDVARRQMDGRFGQMFSITLEGGESQARRLMSLVSIWRPGTSFGGVQSMMEHRASVEADYPPTPPNLVRFSVGLEDPDDLIADLVSALDAL